MSAPGSTFLPFTCDTFGKYARLRRDAIWKTLWAAVALHDIANTKCRARLPPYVPSLPHPEAGAYLMGLHSTPIKALFHLNDRELARAQWLVRWHDVLGNMYTGERSPTVLDTDPEGLWSLPRTNSKALMEMLLVVTLCDTRGYDRGILTDAKAEFWWSLLVSSERQRLAKSLCTYRLQRWTGDAFGRPDATKCAYVEKPLYNNAQCQLMLNAGIHIIDGFYLFLELAREKSPADPKADPLHLAHLLAFVANAWNTSILVLRFEDTKNIDAYRRLRLKTPVDGGTMRVCPL